MKKWTVVDLIILILEIISPIISILTTCFFPSGQNMSDDVKVAIISAGISIPIILIQFSLTCSQKNSEEQVHLLESKIEELEDKINHVSPILERVFASNNDRIKRFAYRRMEEITSTISTSIDLKNSGNLRPTEYYNELFYLTDLIRQDYIKYKKNFSGEIWAMTSFAKDEWIANRGYEQIFIERLKEISDLGITSRRLCIVPDRVYNLISDQQFQAPLLGDNPSFDSFMGLLRMYYRDSTTQKKNIHYFLRENNNSELSAMRGFFAIRLTNGELHILYGETSDTNAEPIAKVLFDQTEIQNIRSLFDQYAKPVRIMHSKLDQYGSNSFKTYLQSEGINL